MIIIIKLKNSRQIKLFVGFAANFAFKNEKETFD